MSSTIIHVENLGKKYILDHQQQESYKTFREVISKAAKSFTDKFKPSDNKVNQLNYSKHSEFWALNDISFEIKQGEKVGIIGRNGAGKSTLLKILSRITEPTKGRVRIRGRVASLLEVGTGFHPELTGRENIFLNGSILGMTKEEIRRKFDEIVTFAEVEKFLDTPVKRYSSGMYVRLAFAVAAHLEPEILIVDEVLAVGDAQFQKKCLSKMEEVGQQGRTVLFVSHNMGMITQLCEKAIYLKQGEVIDIDEVNTVVCKYLQTGIFNEGSIELIKDIDIVRKNKKIFISKLSIINHENIVSTEIDVRYPFYVKIEYEVTQNLTNVEISVDIFTGDGRPVTTTSQSDYAPHLLEKREPGKYQVTIQFPGIFFMPGPFMITVAAYEPMGEMIDIYEKVMSFNVIDTGIKLSKYKPDHSIGVVMVDLPWIEALHIDEQKYI
ncbi:MAG: ABC transporter ATP-binding protein [Scytonematopsis contorta HA4267-MV1]|jgi:lipopolysaccharide transport system ATP-binding protein|nr:ABC transporter ATP-binding protein [Scytonematopsis contorta HA4267-MV1]